MANRFIKNLKIENARIIFKNFSGNPDRFHPDGAPRNFGVIIDDPVVAQDLEAEGWNIKYLRPREEGDLPTPYLTVKLKYTEKSQPMIRKVAGRHVTLLDDDTVGSLDYDQIESADIVVRPYEYEPGKISAWVVEMFANIEVSAFADKYDFDNQPPFDMN